MFRFSKHIQSEHYHKKKHLNTLLTEDNQTEYPPCWEYMV